MSTALAKRLDQIQRSGFKSRDIAQLLSTRPETVSRWRSGRVDPHPETLQRLLTLEYLAGILAELFGAEEARLWLFAPHRLLDGDSPADRISEGALDDVLALVDQLESGAFA